MRYVFGNWKENKNLEEAQNFVAELAHLLAGRNRVEKKLVLLPPSIFLAPLGEQIKELLLPVELGVQDVSSFEEGAYTGEISARMVVDLAGYALLGHSERRRFFGENYQTVNEKIKLCQKYQITPLVCLSSTNDLGALELSQRGSPAMIVYEDSQKIGGEETANLGEIIQFCRAVRSRFSGKVKFIYGGSVGPQNARTLWQNEEIDGLLVGHHSLKAGGLMEIFLS